ncbi:uncharacterized protein YALI1_E14089g [Yarrowia lipolytica]|uniref:Uncharacterized protein n=1 Tax=Yarrowia lipolytica TaxID=4952 RepID=A0A1D8NI09_YARLL|nr:hypothetical protein YALI1_E14089g [Yarrowia lipolytica]
MTAWSIWEDQVISVHVKQYHKAYTVRQMAQELANANVFKSRTLAEIEQRVWVSGTVKSQASNSKKAIHCRASPTRRVFLYTVGLVGLTHDLQRRELMTSAGESGGA